MTSLKFTEWQCHDDRPAMSQEDGAKRVLGFAGIHTLVADTLIDVGAASEFTDADPGPTWSFVGDALRGTISGGSAIWYGTRHQTAVGGSFKITFTKTGDVGGFLFCCDVEDDLISDGYMVWWDGTDVGLGEVGSVSDLTDLTVLPCAETGDAEVTVSVRQRSHTKIDEVDDLEVSLWFDGKLLLSHAMEYEEKGNYIGFAIYGPSDTVDFGSIRVSQAHKPVEWTSVDPSESAASGLGRVLAHTGLRIQAQYDGSVKLWRNDESTSVWTVPNNRIIQESVDSQVYWPLHLRLVGALHEADNFRSGGQGHIFGTGNDPNALTDSETVDKSESQHKKQEEQATTKVLVMPPNPVIEPEDVITVRGTKWRVSFFSYNAILKGEVPVLSGQYNLRKCLEE